MLANDTSMQSTTNIKPLICLDAVGYTLNTGTDTQKTLVEDVSFKIKPFDVISLIGPNGAGKSTLVKLILGLVKPSKGKIIRQKIKIGYVPQKFSTPAILPLRVRDLLAQATCPFDKDNKQVILDSLLIGVLADKQVIKLSGGELQRVLLCRALLQKPDLLVLDEPMQGLDPEAQKRLYALIDCLPDFVRCAMLVVSHDLHWVMKGTKQVICLNKHICCMGTPASVANHDDFINLFGNHYSKMHGNEVPYIHEHAHCHHT